MTAPPNLVGIRLADDIAEALEVVNELPDRLGRDVRPRGDRRQAGAAIDVDVSHDGRVRWPLWKAGCVYAVHDAVSEAHVGEAK